MAAGDKLTPKQIKFCKCYAVTHNAAESARTAGYSPNGAEVTGFRLLRNAKIQKFIAEEEKKVPDNIPDKDKILQYFAHMMREGTKESIRMNAAIQLAKIQGFYRDEW